jgi:hypothetical protein
VESQDHSLVIRLDDPDEQNQFILEKLVSAGARIKYVEEIRPSLEDVYLRLIDEPESSPKTKSAIANRK